MNPKTRDNLIYLAVGLAIAGFLVGMDFYAYSHGKAAPRFSKFATRAATTPLLTGYFIAREAHRRLNATVVEMVPCILAGTLLSLIVSFGFRQAVGTLPTIYYMYFAAIEAFLIIELVIWAISYFRRLRRA